MSNCKLKIEKYKVNWNNLEIVTDSAPDNGHLVRMQEKACFRNLDFSNWDVI